MFEEKIVRSLYKKNIEFLNSRGVEKNNNFYIFFKSIIDSTHILIKIAYKILIFFLIFFFFINKILFISKKLEFNLFGYLINFLNKIYFFKEILKLIKTYSIIYFYD